MTNTKNDAKNIKNVINGIIAFDYSIDSGEFVTQNIYGNEGAPLTVEVEPTSKLYDSTYSFKITTSLGTLSMINGIGTKAYRYETPLNDINQRYIIERGSNIYSQYTLNGYETERDYGITTFVYNRFTVSKIAIALVMISPELSAVEYKLNRAISFINNLARTIRYA